jgi:hypothetical protein
MYRDLVTNIFLRRNNCFVVAGPTQIGVQQRSVALDLQNRKVSKKNDGVVVLVK